MPYVRWVILCVLAELFGIGAAAIWYGGVNVLFGEPGTFLPRIGVWLLMTLAAVPEGVILGGLQAAGVRWFLPAVSAIRWIAATIAVGLLGWGIGTFMSIADYFSDIGLRYILLRIISVGMGAVAGRKT